MKSGFNLKETLKQLIAHELGHADAYATAVGPGADSDARSVRFENTQRDKSQKRPAHKPTNPKATCTCPSK